MTREPEFLKQAYISSIVLSATNPSYFANAVTECKLQKHECVGGIGSH